MSILCGIISSALNLLQDCWGKQGEGYTQTSRRSRIQASNIPGQRLPVTTSESDCFPFGIHDIIGTNHIFTLVMWYSRATLASGQKKSKWPSVIFLEQSFWKLRLHIVQAVLSERKRGRNIIPMRCLIWWALHTNMKAYLSPNLILWSARMTETLSWEVTLR